jgi:hypothetical protein
VFSIQPMLAFFSRPRPAPSVRRIRERHLIAVDLQSLQLGVKRSVVLDAEEPRGLGFHAFGFFHRAPQIAGVDLVQEFSQVEADSAKRNTTPS